MRRVFALAAAIEALALPALADLPVNGCYAHDYDAAHLAAHPAQGVAALRLWFHDEVPGQTARRAVAVEARMADQGQGARDGVGGLTLTQYAYCDSETGVCGVECDGGSIVVEPGDTGISITTGFFVIGNDDVCGGISDLAEATGQVTRYTLAAASIDACESLWRQSPLPAPGCYGVDYDTASEGVMALRLRMDDPDPTLGEAAFSMLSGRLGATLAEEGRAAAARMAGARASRALWCSTFDGACRAQSGDGWFAIDPGEGDEFVITIARFALFGPGTRQFDLSESGRAPAVHRLRPLPASQCRGL